MNITLSAPAETVQTVRQWAAGANTSLNQFIRDALEDKAKAIQAERDRKADEFVRLMESLPPIHMPPGWKFDREEANFRDMKCLHYGEPETGPQP